MHAYSNIHQHYICICNTCVCWCERGGGAAKLRARKNIHTDTCTNMPSQMCV